MTPPFALVMAVLVLLVTDLVLVAVALGLLFWLRRRRVAVAYADDPRLRR